MRFLEQIAADLIQKYGRDLSKVTLVFPNQRSATLFTRFLSRQAGQTLWCPELLSISGFIRSLSNVQPADKLSLLYELHKTWEQVTGQQEPFAQFYFWGELLLRDFDEADRWMCDVATLFKSVKDQKELDAHFAGLEDSEMDALRSFWAGIGTDKDVLSEGQKKFLQLWETLMPVYTAFQNRLAQSHITYEGLMYRQVATHHMPDINQNRTYIFAGFNYLTSAEEEIIKKYIIHLQATVYWDIDAWYMDNTEQEAGLFLRRYKSDPILGPTFPTHSPAQIINTAEVMVSALPARSAQCMAAAEIIQDLMLNKGIPEDEIAIILPAEDLLFPLLNALPAQVQKINITMGYPLRHTPWYSLVEHLAMLREQDAGRPGEFWFKPVMALLTHPLLADANSIALAEQFRAVNRIRIRPDDLKSLTHSQDADTIKWNLVFSNHQAHQFLETLMHILRHLADAFQIPSGPYDINRDFMYQFYTQINRLNGLIRENEWDPGEGGWLPLFRQMLKQIRLPFSGEPLEGIQIMGVLESRNLDYQYVIVLAMEEGHFPPAADSSSFIPFNLRKAFGLPLPAWQDAAYAYYFYRLLHHAEHLWLLYTPSGDGTGGAEKSRYILQLDAEQPNRAPQNSPYLAKALPGNLTPPQIILPNHPDLLNQLYYRFERGISPSALNTFIACSLKFAYQHILKIQEPEEISEEIDPAQLGSVLHKAIELLYTSNNTNPQDPITMNPASIQALKPRIAEVIDAAFREIIFKDLPPRWEGRNLIIRSVLQKYMEGILHADSERGDFEILQTEVTLSAPLQVVTTTGEEITVLFKGNIDRVDRTENEIRIIDYKTGKDDRKFSSIEDLTDATSDKNNKAALQTLIYGWMWLENNPDYQNGNRVISAGLYTMREVFNNQFDFRLIQKSKGSRTALPLTDIRPLLPELTDRLQGVIQQMIDPDFVYAATANTEICQWCGYKEICGR
jgi:hypothetical protein